MTLPKKETINKLVEKAKENPIISSLCHQLGLSRATFYRWLEEDQEFKKQISRAQKIGRLSLCDLAESRVMSLIKNGNDQVALNAAKYVLNNNSPTYKISNSIYKKMKIEEKITELEQECIRLKKQNKIEFIVTHKEHNLEKDEDGI